MYTEWDDTIVALATPPGIGAIGVIRLSGKRAFEISNSLFPSKNLLDQPSHTLHVGLLRDEDKILDEVVISLYKAPRSYTGEDVIEISSHGSPFVLQQIIDACINRQARLAKPGEFTQRAFLNGKLDLAQAEAVADLIASNTEASRKAALHTIRGGFSVVLQKLRDQLLQFSALIELELDFSQEDVEFADRTRLYGLIEETQTVTRRLLESFKLGNVIKHGVQIAIIGKPNTGKSTLLNTLLNENRAIVSDIAGTTRDTIEEVINIDGILFRLIDTAGIREHTSDIIEKIGVERSREKIQQADLVVYLFDIMQETEEQLEQVVKDFETQNVKYLLVANKVDLVTRIDTNTGTQMIANEDAPSSISSISENSPPHSQKFASPNSRPVRAHSRSHISISAKENKHIEVLKERLVDAVLQGNVNTEDTIVTNARHYHALKELSQSLKDIKEGMDNKIPTDLVALDIRRGLHYLGEITGEITNEDQLDYIFSKFCIGK